MIEPYWTSKDGRFVIYCGDCLDILPTLGKVDAVVTDPPYGIGKAEWDIEFPTDWYKYAREISTTVYTMPGNTALPLCIAMVGKDYQDVISLWLSNGMTLGNIGFGNWIPVVVSQRKRVYLGKQNAFRVIVNPSEKIDHPSPKPIMAMTQLLSQHGGETILDPFMGSGTTGVACARLGRKFIGIEISKKYCEIAVQRIKLELSQPRLELEQQPNLEQADLF